jgi:hypothetical protein
MPEAIDSQSLPLDLTPPSAGTQTTDCFMLELMRLLITLPHISTSNSSDVDESYIRHEHYYFRDSEMAIFKVGYFKIWRSLLRMYSGRRSSVQGTSAFLHSGIRNLRNDVQLSARSTWGSRWTVRQKANTSSRSNMRRI